jgi:hypothetical protein
MHTIRRSADCVSPYSAYQIETKPFLKLQAEWVGLALFPKSHWYTCFDFSCRWSSVVIG